MVFNRNSRTVIGDFIDVGPVDVAAYEKQLAGLTYPIPARTEYRVRLVALRDFAVGQPLPTRLEVVQDEWIVDKGTRLAGLTVGSVTPDKALSNVELGLAAFRPLANAVRARRRVLGVTEPYASGRVGMGVTELERLGAMMREDTPSQVELVAVADTPVWRREGAGVKVVIITKP